MMTGFEKLVEDISVGAMFAVMDAPPDRAFTQAFWEGKTHKPSMIALESAKAFGLLRNIDHATYVVTPHGKAFRDFVTNRSKERRLQHA
jgi:hypothetical protein